MLVAFQLLIFLVDDLLTPDWQREVHDIAREVVAAMAEARES